MRRHKILYDLVGAYGNYVFRRHLNRAIKLTIELNSGLNLFNIRILLSVDRVFQIKPFDIHK